MFGTRPILALALLVTVASAARAEFPRYSMQRIGFADTMSGRASRINQRGDVIGTCTRSNNVVSGFFVYGETLVDLELLSPTDINNRREIAGFLRATNGEYHAAVYHRGTLTDLSSLVGKPYSAAYGINDKGDLVGWSVDTLEGDPFSQTPLSTAFLIRQKKLKVLDVGFQSSAERINNRGDIGGFFSSTGGVLRAQRFIEFEQDGRAFDFNGRRVMAGAIFYSLGPWGAQAAIYRNRTWHVLGALPGDTASFANGINSRLQIVGTSFHRVTPQEPFTGTAFLWQTGVMTNLNDLVINLNGWRITEANGINNRGWIAGNASQGGADFPVLLRPVRD